MIEYLEHHIVDHCNLNCAGCSHFSPLAQPWFEDLVQFKKDFSQLWDITKGNVGTIRLMGGEPLLHPQFDEFMAFTCGLFPHTQVQIVTNGILIGQEYDKLKDLSDKFSNFSICISTYGLKLNEERISHLPRVRRDSKMELYNIGFELDGGFNQQKAFNNCDLHVNKWYYFQNGRFYHCCIDANIHYFNEHFDLELPEDDGISIYLHTEEEIHNFLNKPIPLCEYCNTIYRQRSYHPFNISKKEINEWTCQ